MNSRHVLPGRRIELLLICEVLLAVAPACVIDACAQEQAETNTSSFTESLEASADELPKTLFTWNTTSDEHEDQAPEDDSIVTDRPHFSEASSLVGLGRVQVESGFTLYLDSFSGTRSKQYSFPETLYRIGLFQEWFELRVGYNYLVEKSHDGFGNESTLSGSDDLYLGAKLALTEQEGWLPEMAIFPQARIPTGHKDFTSGEVLPGFNLAYSWLISDFIELECNTQLNRRKDGSNHLYLEAIQTANVEYLFSDRFEGFTEWFCLLPDGSIDPGTGPQHYLHGGFAFKIRPNVQADIHSGVGLNSHSTNAFHGAGFSFRL